MRFGHKHGHKQTRGAANTLHIKLQDIRSKASSVCDRTSSCYPSNPIKNQQRCFAVEIDRVTQVGPAQTGNLSTVSSESSTADVIQKHVIQLDYYY